MSRGVEPKFARMAEPKATAYLALSHACVRNKNACLDCNPIRELGAAGVSIRFAQRALSPSQHETPLFLLKRAEFIQAVQDLERYALAHILYRPDLNSCST